MKIFFGDIMLVLTLIVLFVFSIYSKERKAISLFVLSEQCLTYLFFASLFGFPLILKILLGWLYLFIFIIIKDGFPNKSIQAISKIYFAIGIYHFLMAIEPYFIESLFKQSSSIIPYIYKFHFVINLISNLLIIFLVLFGGFFDHGSRSRKPTLHDLGICDFGTGNFNSNPTTNKSREAR